MKRFLNKPTVNPMHNVLRRAIESLDTRQQDIIAQDWHSFFTKFQETCDSFVTKRPGQGLYTTGAIATLLTCSYMQRQTQDLATASVFDALGEKVSEQQEAFEDIDTRVGMYWYAFAEQYGNVMPHCNNRVMEDFQHAVATAAHQEYIHNPDRDIRFTGLEAVQQATIEIARRHPDNEMICKDMTWVSKIASEQKSMMYSEVVLTVEPKDLVCTEPEIDPFTMFMEEETPNPFTNELQRALYSLESYQVEAIAANWDNFKAKYDASVQNLHTEYDWAGPYQIALYALRDTAAAPAPENASVAYKEACAALDGYVSRTQPKAVALDRQMFDVIIGHASGYFDNDKAPNCNATVMHEFVDAATRGSIKHVFEHPEKAFMTNVYDAVMDATETVIRMNGGEAGIRDDMHRIADEAADAKNEMLRSWAVPKEFAQEVDTQEQEEVL